MWWTYVQRVAQGATLTEIAEKIGVYPASVSRWKNAESVRPANVAAFARAYGRPVLEAFVAAGYLTAEEAGARFDKSMTAADLTDDDLLRELTRRVGEASRIRQRDAELAAARGTEDEFELYLAEQDLADLRERISDGRMDDAKFSRDLVAQAEERVRKYRARVEATGASSAGESRSDVPGSAQAS